MQQGIDITPRSISGRIVGEQSHHDYDCDNNDGDDGDYTGKDLNICSVFHSNFSEQMNSEKSVDDDPEALNCNANSIDFIHNKILRIEERFKDGVRKEYSPQLRTKIGNIFADSTIDEGSELNCIDSSIAARCAFKAATGRSCYCSHVVMSVPDQNRMFWM